MSASNPEHTPDAKPFPAAPNKHMSKLLAKAENLGVPGNVALAQYVLILEERLETLETKLGIERQKSGAV